MTNILDLNKLSGEAWELIDRTRHICADHSCPISMTMMRDASFYIGSQIRKGDSVLAKLTMLTPEAQLVMIAKLIVLGQRTATEAATGPEISQHFVPANKDFHAVREMVAAMYNVCHGYMQAAGLHLDTGKAFWEEFQREPPLQGPMGSALNLFTCGATVKCADLSSKACGAYCRCEVVLNTTPFKGSKYCTTVPSNVSARVRSSEKLCSSWSRTSRSSPKNWKP